MYVRERKVLRLEDAIHKMTWLNATKIGLTDRGIVLAGAKADLTVFAEDSIIDKSTYTDPFHYSEGIEWVIVNGQIAMEQGRPTSARPGKALSRRNN